MISRRYSWGKSWHLVMLAACICAVGLLSGCDTAKEDGLVLTGSFLDETVTLSMPSLLEPHVDLAIGTTAAVESTSALNGAPASALVAEEAGLEAILMRAPNRWHQIGSALVAVGDEVTAGQILVEVAYPEGAAAVSAGEADLAKAKADLALIDEMSGDVTQGRSDIASQTIELNNTISDLQTQKTELQIQLDEALAQLPPSSGTTPTPPPPGLIEQIARLEAAITGIDVAVAQAEQALEELSTARIELDEAQNALGSIRSTAAAVVEARKAILEVTRAQIEMAVIVAPSNGVITHAVTTGAVVAEGAPLVVLRTVERPLVRSYLTSEQAKLVRDGSSARISLDSMPDTEYTGLVVGIDSAYDFVPTTFASPIIHLTRGFEVTIEVYGAPDLPPGTPADIEIQTN